MMYAFLNVLESFYQISMKNCTAPIKLLCYYTITTNFDIFHCQIEDFIASTNASHTY
jgi:hypothetical protein